MNHSHAPANIDELFTIRCVRFYPGVNSRAELVTIALGSGITQSKKSRHVSVSLTKDEQRNTF